MDKCSLCGREGRGIREGMGEKVDKCSVCGRGSFLIFRLAYPSTVGLSTPADAESHNFKLHPSPHTCPPLARASGLSLHRCFIGRHRMRLRPLAGSTSLSFH